LIKKTQGKKRGERSEQRNRHDDRRDMVANVFTEKNITKNTKMIASTKVTAT
jgi:hypothetical protein